MPGLGSSFVRPAVIVMALLGSPMLATGVSAQQQQNLSQQFLQNPAQMLQQYPNGGTAMISQLREIAIADPKALEAILALVPNANKDQKTAIGSALGQAAKVVVKTNQAYANQILQAIAQTKDQDVFLAYSGVNPDQGTAAAGGGGGGAGGGAGGQTNALGGLTGGTGGAEAIGGGSTPTGPFSYTSSVSGTGGTGGTTTSLTTTSLTTTTTITTSTSP